MPEASDWIESFLRPKGAPEAAVDSIVDWVEDINALWYAVSSFRGAIGHRIWLQCERTDF